jgi:prepilin-type N-terminal cleavage/methylation domain-containing protein
MKNSANYAGLLRVAFTLVELLTVIAIIGILAALLLVVLPQLTKRMQTTRAHLQIKEIVAAIQSYDNVYGRFPVSDNAQAAAIPAGGNFTYGGTFPTPTGPTPVGTAVNGAVLNNAEVIAILMNATSYGNGQPTVNAGYAKNPQRTIFLNAKMTGDTSSPGVGLDGVYRDPWGDPYVISLNVTAEGLCQDAFYKSPTLSAGGLNGLVLQPDGNYAARTTIMVWSAGPDKMIDPRSPASGPNAGVNKDNVLSWTQ